MVGDFDDVLNSGKEVSLSRWWTNLEFLLGEVRRDEGAKTKRVKWKSNEPEDKAAFALPRNHQLLLVQHWRRLGCWIFIHSTSQNLCHMPYVICNMSYIDIYKYSALKPCMKTSCWLLIWQKTRFQLILPVHSHNVTKNLTGHRMHVQDPQIC